MRFRERRPYRLAISLRHIRRQGSGVTQTGTRVFVIAIEGAMFSGPFTGAAGWGPQPCYIAAVITPTGN